MASNIFILRYSELDCIPVAFSQTQLLVEAGLDPTVYEYSEKRKQTPGLLPWRLIRFQPRILNWIPKRLRPISLFALTFLHLSFLFMWRQRPKLMVAHGLSEQTLAWLLSIVFRVRYVVDVHEIYSKEDLRGFNRWLFAREKRALRRAEFLVFPHKQRAELYRDRYQIERQVFTVYNCPRKREKKSRFDLKSQLGIPSDHKLLLYMGGIGEANCLEEGIMALAQVPKLCFLILGWGENKYLRHLVRVSERFKVDDRVFFLGATKQRWTYLDNCDLGYCLYRPTVLRLQFASTASNKLGEYLAAGLPVLTSSASDFKHLVEPDLGICLEEISPESIASALNQWVTRPTLYSHQQKATRQAHLTDWHYEAQFARPLALLKELAQPTRVQVQG